MIFHLSGKPQTSASHQLNTIFRHYIALYSLTSDCIPSRLYSLSNFMYVMLCYGLGFKFSSISNSILCFHSVSSISQCFLHSSSSMSSFCFCFWLPEWPYMNDKLFQRFCILSLYFFNCKSSLSLQARPLIAITLSLPENSVLKVEAMLSHAVSRLLRT